MWVLVGGVAFVAAGGLGIYQDRRLNRIGVRVSGTVVGVHWKSAGKGGGRIPQPVVEFRTVEGRAVRTPTLVGGSRPNPAAGTRVPLLYDPARPDHVNIDTSSGRGTWIPVVFLAVGLGLIAWAAYHGEV